MIDVDVILISYNQEQYIAQAIESILSQEISDDIKLRVIIADDCSTDRTLDIIKSYEVKSIFQFLYLDSNENLGIAKNYERSFNISSGDYIAVLEGDDYWMKGHLMQHIRFLQQNKKFSMSINRFNFLKNNQLINSHWPYTRSYMTISTKEQISNGNQLGNLSACVIRNNALKKIDKEIFNYKDMADWELGILISEHGLIGKLKDCTSVYRLNPKGEWTNLDDKARFDSRMNTINFINSITKYKYKKQFSILIDRIKKGESFSITTISKKDKYCTWFYCKIKKILYEFKNFCL